ncbi:hypothetical protein M422DRAFT_242628 [Sphaerobolus stellatus SS14]|nr:hypothetical protein M422DRAFT_242628 [Sphaerobolus stellatus SS14]
MQKAPKSLIVFQSGKGAVLKDVTGVEYTDLLGGIIVSNLGRGREEIMRATGIDPPHELFFNKKNMKAGENVGQTAARVLEERILEKGPESVTAFIFEPVQGDRGAVLHHPNFFSLTPEICDKYNALMIADEIMALQRPGLGSALSSGYLPMGEVIYTDRIW